MSRNRLYILILIFAVAGYILVFINVKKEAGTEPFHTLCIFKTLTGVPCPACGTTRSVSLIVVGKFHKALITNPLGFLAAFLLISYPLVVIIDLLQKKNRAFIVYIKTEQLFKRKWIAIIGIILILINWAWNIYKEL